MPCGAWTQAPCRVAPGLQAPYRVAPGLPRRPHRRSLALTRSTRHTARRQRPSATRDGASLLPGPKRHTGWRLAPLYNQRAAPRSPARAHFNPRVSERRERERERGRGRRRRRRRGEEEEEEEEGGGGGRVGGEGNFFYRFNFVYI